MKFAFEVTAAKPKGKESEEDSPSQLPMAPRGGQRRSPSTDQKKVRREMAKKAGIEEQVARMVRNGKPWVSDCPNPFCRDGAHTECSGVGCDCPCHAYGFSEMGFFASKKKAAQTSWYTQNYGGLTTMTTDLPGGMAGVIEYASTDEWAANMPSGVTWSIYARAGGHRRGDTPEASGEASTIEEAIAAIESSIYFGMSAEGNRKQSSARDTPVTPGPGEQLCPVCLGWGEDDDERFECPGCGGAGVVPADGRKTAGFWDAIDAQLAEAAQAKTADDVLRIFGPDKVPQGGAEFFSGEGFFSGSGGDATLYGALMKAGWTWVKGDDIFWVMKAPNGDLITYIEGDIYRGDQMGTNASRKTAGDEFGMTPEEIDSMWNAQYWKGQADSARRRQEGIRKLLDMKGQEIVVIRGRKIPLGTRGTVFWVGETKYGWRVGFKGADGMEQWTDANNVELASESVTAARKTAAMDWKYQDGFGWYVNPADFTYGYWAKIEEEMGGYVLLIIAASGDDAKADQVVKEVPFSNLEDAKAEGEAQAQIYRSTRPPWSTMAARTASRRLVAYTVAEVDAAFEKVNDAFERSGFSKFDGEAIQSFADDAAGYPDWDSDEPADLKKQMVSINTMLAIYNAAKGKSGVSFDDGTIWDSSGKSIADARSLVKSAMEGMPMQAPNSPYGALPADAQQQGMGESDDNAEPAPLGGAAASLHTAGYITVNGQDFDYDYEPDPDGDGMGNPGLIVYLLDADTGEVLDAMGGVDADFDVSDHGNTNLGQDAERYIKEIATEMAQSHLSTAASLAVRSARFEAAPVLSPDYHAAVAAARRSITSGARDAGIL